MAQHERKSNFPEDTALTLHDELSEALLHPLETYLRNGDAINIDAQAPLLGFAKDDFSILALLSLPSHLAYYEGSKTILGFRTKYAVTCHTNAGSKPTYGLAAYYDEEQTISRPYVLNHRTKHLLFGRQSIKLAQSVNEKHIITELPWAHPALQHLTSQIGLFVTRACHFKLSPQFDGLTISDSSRYGTRVLSQSLSPDK